jgi:hypothetical protein
MSRIASWRRGHAVWGFVGLQAASTLSMLGLMAWAPDPSGRIALFYPPATTASEAASRAVAAGGRPIRYGQFDWIIVVASDRADRGFAARAHAGGAWALINPMLAGGCVPDAPPRRGRTPGGSSTPWSSGPWSSGPWSSGARS